MNPSAITRLADLIDRLNGAIGRAASWCALAIVLIGFAVVLLRYVLGVGSIWLQESILYAHAALLLLAAAWTLGEGGHVRVDVFYAHASPRAKAWVDLGGALFLLLPFALAIIVFALPYVQRSWATLERSRETSGLPLVFLLKTLIPLFALTLALQGIAQAIRAVSLLIPPPQGEGGPPTGRQEAPPDDELRGPGGIGEFEVGPHPARFARHPPPSGEGWTPS